MLQFIGKVCNLYSNSVENIFFGVAFAFPRYCTEEYQSIRHLVHKYFSKPEFLFTGKSVADGDWNEFLVELGFDTAFGSWKNANKENKLDISELKINSKIFQLKKKKHSQSFD